MNLQFLQIGQMNGQPVAFFIDQQTSTVYAYRVVDMTGQQRADIIPPALYRPSAPMQFNHQNPPVGFEVVPTRPNLPDKPVSIIPPEFARMGAMDGDTMTRVA